MKFIQTQIGLITQSTRVRIGPINIRPAPIPSWHDVDYAHGNEARSTRATAEAINNFFDQIARENLNAALERATARP